MPPTSATLKLSNVAAEYLRNHDELEAARELFIGERGKLLDEFGSMLIEGAGQKTQNVAGSRRNDTAGMFEVDINGEYVAVRAKTGKKRSSGYSIGIGSFLGHVGAQTLLWFHLKLNPSRKKRLEIPALEKTLGAGVQVVGEGGWLYVRILAMPPSNVDMEVLESEARRLPDLFVIADPWIAKRFED